MKLNQKYFVLFFSVTAMLLLILCAETAFAGAKSGIELCIGSVIPSLFPFITISCILNSVLRNLSYKPLRPLFHICGIPEGCESLLLLGLLGGYPVGAQAINDAYVNQSISKSQANRLLAFCNNAGPAFIFGISSCLFQSKLAPWALWGIHIVSAIIVSIMLPAKNESPIYISDAKTITLPQALNKSLKVTATICGWVIIFKIVISFTEKYLYTHIPTLLQAIVAGTLELTNGFYALLTIPDVGRRFVLASCILSFGGACVMMQTASVTEAVGTGLYFPGKLAQCSISYFLSTLTAPILFNTKIKTFPFTITVLFSCILFISITLLRKNSRFMEEIAV